MAYPFAAAEVLTAANLNAMIGAPTQNAQTGTTYTLALLDAGKLVTLSNASAVAVTVPLQSSVAWIANTQINLLNLGAGTVTVAGAVGVTINGTPLTLAQNARGILIRTASNTWTFVPGVAAAVTPGLHLVTPTSIANSGGSASASGGAVTFTGVTTISVNGCFTSTYDNYVIQIVAVASGAAPAQYIRLRAAGSDNSTASSYVGQILLANGASVSSARTTDSLLQIGEITTTRSAMALNVYSPALAERTVFRSVTANSRDDARIGDIGGTHNQAVAYDGFTISLSSLNTTGVLRVYGYQNS